ncbi:unnamed protein product [Orchesella dallaii]|uniref:Uncharacterized protein n=1 Tax=Orchesella dallaii TaxID=48710 RepID=A0ABP1RBZ7_9HEXA
MFYIYSKITQDDLEEDWGNELYYPGTPFTTTNIMGMVLACLIGMVAIIAYRILAYYPNMTYLLNQIFKYVHSVEDLMKRKKKKFTMDQQQTIKACELLLSTVAVLSTAVPLGYGMFFTSADEPVHQLLKEWLGFDVNLDVRSSPIVLLFSWAALAGGGATYMLLNLGSLYMFLALICISSLIPTQIHKPCRKAGKKCLQYSIETTSLGTMTEEESIISYRTQQGFTN